MRFEANYAAQTAPNDVAKPHRRRSSHRVPCRLRVLSSSAPGAAIGETVNVSDGGIAVHLGKDVAPGAHVEVLLPRLDGDPICVYGEVVRRRRVFSGTFEIGIALNQPAPPVC